MAAKSDIKKKRSPEIEIVWKGNVPEATYFNRNDYSIVAKVENGQFILARDGWDDDPEKKDVAAQSLRQDPDVAREKRHPLRQRVQVMHEKTSPKTGEVAFGSRHAVVKCTP